MPTNAESVREKLLSAHPKVVDLAKNGRVPFETLCSLLFLHAPKHEKYEFRYLGSGRSESEALLLVQHPGRLRVVKVGPAQEIEQETSKLDLAKDLARAVRPSDFDPREVEVNGYRSISSSFATDSESAVTLESALLTGGYHSSHIEQVIKALIRPVFRWCNPQIEVKSPFMFPWEEQGGHNICQALNVFGPDVQSLLEVVNDRFHFRDGTLKTFVGNCHGDLNVGNVIIGISPKKPVSPCLIDFTWASSGRFSPAHDWSKLERDIKLSVLRTNLRNRPEDFNSPWCKQLNSRRSGIWV
jgi:hypothetical protein